MPLDAGQITTLRSLRKIKLCAYLAVYWDPDDDETWRYYSDAVYSEMAGYLNIGIPIEAQLPHAKNDSLAKSVKFEIDPDIKAEKITFTFNDIPARGETERPISTRPSHVMSDVLVSVALIHPNFARTRAVQEKFDMVAA